MEGAKGMGIFDMDCIARRWDIDQYLLSQHRAWGPIVQDQVLPGMTLRNIGMCLDD